MITRLSWVWIARGTLILAVIVGIIWVLRPGKVRGVWEDEPPPKPKKVSNEEKASGGQAALKDKVDRLVKSSSPSANDGDRAVKILQEIEALLREGTGLEEVEESISKLLPLASTIESSRPLIDSLANRGSPSCSMRIAKSRWDPTTQEIPKPREDLLRNLKAAANGGYVEAKFFYGTVLVARILGEEGEEVLSLDKEAAEWLEEAARSNLNKSDFVRDENLGDLFSPPFYAAVAHHVRAVQLKGSLMKGVKDAVAERLGGEAESIIRDHSRIADELYSVSLGNSWRPFERHFARLFQVTLRSDDRLFSDYMYDANSKKASVDLEEYFQKDFEVMLDLLIEKFASEEERERIGNLERHEAAVHCLKMIIAASPSTRFQKEDSPHPADLLLERISKLERLNAESGQSELRTPPAVERTKDVPERPMFGQALNVRALAAIKGYLKASTNEHAAIGNFIHPAGFNSFGKLVRREEAAASHSEYIRATYREFKISELGDGQIESDGAGCEVRIPVFIKAKTMDGQSVETVSFRRYLLRDTSGGLLITSEEFLAYFALAKSGYSILGAGKARVKAADGKLAIRSEPSTARGESTVIRYAPNDSIVHYWPLPYSAVDQVEGRTINWVLVVTGEGVVGLSSIKGLQEISPATRNE
jgi:hypothetical protein